MMNKFSHPSNGKIYGKITSLWRTNFTTALALRYIEAPLYKMAGEVAY